MTPPMTPPTTPSAADLPGSSDRGTERLPLGARGGGLTGPRARQSPVDDDTGPVPIVGDRPAPSTPRSGDQVQVAPDEPLPEEVADLPATEQPAGSRAGRNLGAAI